ncbi:response regulator [Pelagibius litoralis]|uniref:Response regulator n=1 Tax=Pelagibius litoralis TaxID=374515 RepID=A0A967F2E3_9PROT|nr:response regulator [Pelagibius litoralis]NIA71921.1 response regulator [Pelagibius litoralis]
MVGKNALISEEEVDSQIESEALDEARDLVSNLELRVQQVKNGVLDPKEAAKTLAIDSTNLRMKARAVNLTGFGPLTHSLDEYLSEIESVEERHISDLFAFADRINSLLDGETVDAEAISAVLRELPQQSAFNVEDVVITDKSVTVIIPQRTAAKVVGRELAACGYRVSSVTNPIEALELILETKPDLVITSQVMPRLSGVDLACALSAMPATRTIPIALLTSLDPDHPDLKALPMNVGLIRRGAQFGDDLADVLQRFNIT